MIESINLNEKDRKILVQLDKNARQSDSEIAKKARISKQVANYRIQKLLEKGVITSFYTIINTGLIGFNSYYVFLQLERINKKQEKDLLERIKRLDYVGWLVSGVGRWDAALLIYADSISTFDKSLNEVIKICGEHLHEYDFTTLIESEHIKYKLLGKETIESVKQTEKKEKVELEEKDKKILEEISQNARISIVKLSEKTKIPLHVVRYHLNQLIKNGIIIGFKPKINVNKLGYQWHLILIQLNNTSEKRKQDFINFCRQHKNVYYVTNTIGKYNLMIDIHVMNTEEFKEVLLDFKEKFSDIIKLYESLVIFDEYKIDYFPKNLI
ncbi:MAG: winged helix-turn-helix transcriptional regulator [Nanoarchaeota archaeon]|nr:winged helix-turn-helix transcriptional regulator [Nanoarchaeota archaeon]